MLRAWVGAHDLVCAQLLVGVRKHMSFFRRKHRRDGALPHGDHALARTTAAADSRFVPASGALAVPGPVPVPTSVPSSAPASNHTHTAPQDAFALNYPTPPPPPVSVLHRGTVRPAGLKADSRRRGFFARLSWRWRVLLVVPTLAAVSGAIVFASMLIYYTMMFPDPLSLQHKERAPVIRILAQDGSVLAQRGSAHGYVPLGMLPPHVTNAVIATEDRRFHDHWGVDLGGLMRAVLVNMRAGRFVQGGSTLTQQLAKNLFLTRERTLMRKLEELVLAAWLEVRLSKNDILELYLNRVYFGGGAYGIEAASQRYFGKSARALSIPEAAVIAGLLKAPSRYAPSAHPAAARKRGRVVVSNMFESGLLPEDAARKALGTHVVFAEQPATWRNTAFAYAVDYVLERMPGLIAGNHREIVVETTLDADLQKVAQDTVAETLRAEGRAMGAGQAALIILDAHGAIRAMIGGRSYAASQFNRAVTARRQPGSAFKPFVYLSALETGMTPDSTAYDLPLKVEGWAPRNGSGTYRGAVSLRYALAKSINTVAVRLNLDIGANRVAATAKRLGIRSELRPEPSLALGTSEVSVLDMAAAYAVFANGGHEVQPFAIRRVRTNTGRVLYARAGSQDKRIVSQRNIGAMNDMLNAALITGTGKRAGLPRHPSAGKTGTSQQFRDAWFAGYTAHMAGVVWVGNDTGARMKQVMGGNLPATIWHDVMLAAHRAKAPMALPGTARQPSLPIADAERYGAGDRQIEASLRDDADAEQRQLDALVAEAGDARDLVSPPAQPQWSQQQPAPNGAPSDDAYLGRANVTAAQRMPPVRDVLPWQSQPPNDDDLIARVLEALPIDEDEGRAQLARQPTAPPRGMMSLGAR